MSGKREIPSSPECERGVIGSMLVGGQTTIGEVYARIKENGLEWFYVPSHHIIYQELIETWRAGKSVDLLTFTQHLRDKNLMLTIGGEGEVDGMFAFVPSAANVGYYLDELADKRWLRRAIQIGTEIVRKSYEEQSDVEETLRNVEQALMSLVQRHDSFATQRSIKEITSAVIENLGDPEKALGVSTGFHKLDELVGGLAPCAKIVIAGRISSGKSALAANIAKSVAVDRGIKTLVFTFEMSSEQWVQRIIQIHSATSARRVVGANVDMFDVDTFSQSASAVSQSALTVVDDRLDVAGIRARCMQLRSRVAIIDYLQIVPDVRQRGENRTDQLDRMSATTKQIAHQLGITVIELSQLTYDEKHGTFKTRGSQGITADGDQLWVLEGDDDESKDIIDKDVVVAKQREGGRGRVHFSFDKPCTRFTEVLK